VEDICYERRRAEARVDYSAHHALVNAGDECRSSYYATAQDIDVDPFMHLMQKKMRSKETRGCCAMGTPVPRGGSSRGTKHLRLLPKGITGITENDRALQSWLELVDWTGLGVLPNSHVPRKLKLEWMSKI